MAASLLVGIDVGGTSIKMGLITQAGQIVESTSVRTEHLEDSEACCSVASALVEMICGHGSQPSDVAGIGLAVPGVVRADGTLAMAANISLDLASLISAMREAFPGTPVLPLNDANAAALGEQWQGAGGGVPNIVFVTLGTGVGAGIVVDGRLVTGAHGMAGEVGHINVNRDERQPCTCGCFGCLEQYASARGLIRLYREECARAAVECVPIAHATDALAVFNAARAGDPHAQVACDDLADYLGRALATIAAVVDPDAFVIGGGMSGGWDTYGDALLESYRSHVTPDGRDTPIRAARLGNTAGMLGAAAHALAGLDI
jgi:glucokinase